MSCNDLRDRLVAGARVEGDLAEHLPGCPECRAFAERLAAVRGALRQGSPAPLPDPGFSHRVLARLPKSSEVLGWAALRALPAALVVVLALAWFSASEPPSVDTVLSAEPSPDLLLTAGALSIEDTP